MARHRLPGRRETTPVVERTIEMVDTAGTAHFLTLDAAADGRPQGRYAAMCREEIVSGALVARRARWCPLCIPIPRRGVRVDDS
ncbi:MAG TPA: hypothetical protein VFN75_10125 [Pseudonocardiaceae bacterium]|nr:hypothetical protein [Pseudonocardiaceae bacterium]